MKILLLLLSCLLLASCSKVALPPDTQKSLDRTTDYIGHFKSTHATLPTRNDFMAWWRTNNLQGVFDYQAVESGKTGEYFVYIWVEDKMVVYSSKDKTTRILQKAVPARAK
jgi:hypothetical protein